MDVPQPFSDREIAFLEALVAEGVDFLVVGLAAAALQGTPEGARASYRPNQ